jgi:hypothetical protein
MTPEEFDDALIDALWESLHSTHTPCEEVLQGEGERIDKGSKRGTSVYRYTSSVTGNDVFKQVAGNTHYLHGDPETIRYVHEQYDMGENMRKKMKAQHEGRDTYTLKEGGREYSAGTPPVGTTSEERWAYWAAKWGFETECSLSPPTGEGPKLSDLLDVVEKIPDHEWRSKEEGEKIARRVKEAIRDDMGDFEYRGRIQVEFSTSYHGQGFTLWAGQAAWGIGGRNAPEDEVLSNAKGIIEKQAVRHWADPAPSRGSTGEPYFEEKG